jgi:hypothetical protein
VIRIGPAGYIDDDGRLHLNLVALCEQEGVEPTPENQQEWLDFIAAYMRQIHPGVELRVKESASKPGSYVPFSPSKRIRPSNRG